MARTQVLRQRPLGDGVSLSAIKLVASVQTMAKFQVLASGMKLVDELGDDIPEVYGGKGKALGEQERELA